jgi:hypothetical protein
MAGLFFKSLIQRTLAELLKPKRRRRTTGLRHSLECLESRALLSATGYEAPTEAAEVRVINAEDSAPLSTVAFVPVPLVTALPDITSRAKGGSFDKTWNIQTTLGPVSVALHQQGTRVRGIVDLSNVDLSGVIMPSVSSATGQAVQATTNSKLSHVKFKGTVVNNELDGTFKLKLPVAGVVGKANVSGHLTGAIVSNPPLVSFDGHLDVTVGGVSKINQDFSIPISVASPFSASDAATPRISGVAGIHTFQSSGLGNGTLDITQTGQDITGVFDAPKLTSGTIDAHFRTANARTAKGTADLQFTDSQTPETDKFWISFFHDGSLKSFRYR